MARSIPWLAAAVPLLLYLSTTGGSGYWLDAGELVAASAWLDIAHPPGHPLALLYGKLLGWLPLGSQPFRLALGQGIAAAAAAGFAALACELTARRFGLHEPALLAPLALLGAWLPALSFGVWFQAVRPEVYALQLALLSAALAALCRVERRCAPPDPGASTASQPGGGVSNPLLVASLCIGLGLTNHHLMALLCFPALLFVAGVATRRIGVRALGGCASVGLLALGVYAYLPARASTDLPVNLGQPDNLSRLFWVVSAQVYARDMGRDNPQPLWERYADLLVVLVEQMHWGFLLMACWGLYVLLRERKTRRLGVLWLLVVLGVFGVRPWLGPVRSNPDSLGYLGAGFIALGALCTALVAALCAVACQRGVALFRLVVALWMLPPLVVALQVAKNYRRSDLSQFTAVEPFDELRHRSLPARSLVLATTPQTVFRYWEAAAAEGARPDVQVVPLPFMGYPGVAETIAEQHPALSALVNRHRHFERFLSQLRVLARSRPVLVELGTHIPSAFYPRLLPVGLLYAIADPVRAEALLEPAAARQRALHEGLYDRLDDMPADLETTRHLLWIHYMDALYYARRGRIAQARHALEQATDLQPLDQRLARLSVALQGAREGAPLDISRYLAFD